MKTDITQERLKELLSYDESTGEFKWIKKSSKMSNVPIGTKAGNVSPYGYHQIRVDGVIYYSHRLAWLYMFGYFPITDLDHINRIRSDNRIVNLREVTRAENNQNSGMSKNNSTGYPGISFHKATGKYQARIGILGKSKYLGVFEDIEDAVIAQVAAKTKYHPIFTFV